MFNMKKVFSRTAMILAATVALAACGDENDAEVTNTSAQKNSSEPIVVYSSLNEDAMTRIEESFEKTTGIEMDYLLFNSAGEASSRVQAEGKSPQADVLIGGSVEFYEPLAETELLAQYASPNAKDLDPMFLNVDNYFQGWYTGVLAYVLNNERFAETVGAKGVQEPTTWEDITDPAYKDELILPNPATVGSGYIYTATQIFRKGEDEAFKYFEQTAANAHHFTASGGDSINLVSTGEFTIGLHWAHDIIKAAEKGYPIKAIIPEENAIEIGGSAILAGTDQMDESQQFIDWLLSVEGQELIRNETARYSVRDDIAPPAGVPAFSELKLIDYNRVKATEMKEDILSRYTPLTKK